MKRLLLILLFIFISCASFLAYLYSKGYNPVGLPENLNIGTTKIEKIAYIDSATSPSAVSPVLTNPQVLSATNTAPYYGVNVEMSQILPSSAHYVKNSKGQDLIDIAADLGINMFRITNETRSVEDNKDAIYTKEQWYQVLDKMQSKGITAVVLAEASINSSDLYSIDIKPAYIDMVQRYIIDSGVLSHPNVYGVDIKNEPLLTDSNIAMMKKARDLVKDKYPDIKVSVGWWRVDSGKVDKNGKMIYSWDDFAAGNKLDPIVDYYSIHMYGFENKFLGVYPDPELRTKQYLSEVLGALKTSKPVLIEEFGSSNGDAVSDQDRIGTPEMQANTNRGDYQTLKNLNDPQIIGTTGFQFYKRTDNVDAWALLKDNGNYIFPAARVIQNFAKGTNNSISYTSKSNSFLLTTSSNGKTIKVKVGDRVGLQLGIKQGTYKLSFSKDTLKYLTDPLHYAQDRSNYYALFQLKQKGDLTVTVTSGSKTVFKVKLKIE